MVRMNEQSNPEFANMATIQHNDHPTSAGNVSHHPIDPVVISTYDDLLLKYDKYDQPVLHPLFTYNKYTKMKFIILPKMSVLQTVWTLKNTMDS